MVVVILGSEEYYPEDNDQAYTHQEYSPVLSHLNLLRLRVQRRDEGRAEDFPGIIDGHGRLQGQDDGLPRHRAAAAAVQEVRQEPPFKSDGLGDGAGLHPPPGPRVEVAGERLGHRQVYGDVWKVEPGPPLADAWRLHLLDKTGGRERGRCLRIGEGRVRPQVLWRGDDGDQRAAAFEDLAMPGGTRSEGEPHKTVYLALLWSQRDSDRWQAARGG